MTATRQGQRGQAAVETALTMPLALFVILGSLQLFLMLNGRIMAEYAVFRATRAGSVNVGDCRSMTHAAIAALLPTFTKVSGPEELGTEFGLRSTNRYLPFKDGGRSGPVVWLEKRLDRAPKRDHKDSFDDRYTEDAKIELLVDMVFWFPMKIPFANWVIARSYLAAVGVLPYAAMNPLSPTANAKWLKQGSSPASGKVMGEMRNRTVAGEYVFPIRTSHRLRMMTPAVEIGRGCPNSPASL